MLRVFLWLLSLVGAAALGAGLVLLAAGRPALPPPERDRVANRSTPTHPVPPPALRTFDLVVQRGRWEVLPGTVVEAWTYNGQVPGPEIRVREGDRVRVHVTNRLPVPTTIHWHGVELANAMDGVPGLTQPPIPPGGEFTYEFTATPAGTRLYHSHQDSEVQVPLGLYGALIIEPRDGGPRYDREATLFLSELALDFTPAVALGQAPYPAEVRGGALPFDLFLINGRAGTAVPPLTITPGERPLLRLINIGFLPHAMHLHGHTLRIVATDGNPVPPAGQWLKDTILLGPGERVDAEVVGNNPGAWMFHCHMFNHSANGMMTVLVYPGYEHAAHAHPGAALPTLTPTPTVLPPSASPTPTTAPPSPTATATPGPPTPLPTATVGATPTGRPAAGAGATPTPAGGDHTLTLEVGDNFFARTEVRVPRGTTVVWVNTGRNAHTLASLDGLFESPALRPRQTFAYTFQRPGVYPYLCRQHALTMQGRIIVE